MTLSTVKKKEKNQDFFSKKKKMLRLFFNKKDIKKKIEMIKIMYKKDSHIHSKQVLL
jgi:hypothetical protein